VIVKLKSHIIEEEKVIPLFPRDEPIRVFEIKHGQAYANSDT
jgi:hypothetical protein